MLPPPQGTTLTMQKECRQGDGQKPRPGIGISFQPQLRHHHIQFPITGRTSTPSSKVSSNSDPNGPQARRIARRICGKCASQRVLATDVARIQGKKTPSPAAFAENVPRSVFWQPTWQGFEVKRPLRPPHLRKMCLAARSGNRRGKDSR